MAPPEAILVLWALVVELLLSLECAEDFRDAVCPQ